MDYIARRLDLGEILAKKSCFLFGPRQTGKSYLIRHTLQNHRIYDLLDSEVYTSLSFNPKLIEQELQPDDTIIIIDEIQKLPHLLDEIHRLIENRGIRFLLTGSSARKLRRGGFNLLGGRARSRTLHPFIYTEISEKFDLLTALNRGLLPSLYFSDAPQEDLKAYTGDYLREEIAAEGYTRNIPAFSRFLQVASACNSQLINYTKISNDAQIPASTVQEYFQIIKDTLIAFDVPPWKKTVKRKPLSTSKYYFFDIGVVRYLQNRSELKDNSPEMGEAFETYMAHELKSYTDYTQVDSLCYWRSTSGFEVDFILNDTTAIEIKAKKHVPGHDVRGLRALREEGLLKNYILVSLEKTPRKIDGIQILPWRQFLEHLWAGEFV